MHPTGDSSRNFGSAHTCVRTTSTGGGAHLWMVVQGKDERELAPVRMTSFDAFLIGLLFDPSLIACAHVWTRYFACGSEVHV